MARAAWGIMLILLLGGCSGGGDGSSSSSSASTGGQGTGSGTGSASGGGTTPAAITPGRFEAVNAPLQEGRFFHTSTPLPGGQVLLAGGLSDASFLGVVPLPLGSCELFDPQSGLLQTAGVLQWVRFSHRALLEVGGTVLLVGGDFSGAVERWHPSGSSTVVGQLLQTRAQHTATPLATGEILVTGGVTLSLSGTAALSSTELFDPGSGTSRPGPDLGSTRVGHTATLLDTGDVLIVGGTGAVETLIYRTQTGLLEPGPPLALAREDHRTTVLPDGRILVTGGSDPTGHSLASGEILDPGASQFRLLVATLPGIGREDHTQTLLADGTVLITGGEDNGAGPNGDDLIVPDACLFDPGSETFIPLGDTDTPRDDHAATVLPDGSVLLSGGEDAQGSGIPSCERYIP